MPVVRIPDESAAAGAAMMAAILTGHGSYVDVLLLETASTIGVETSGGKLSPILSQRHTIPTIITRKFTVSSDDPDCTAISVATEHGEGAGARAGPNTGAGTEAHQDQPQNDEFAAAALIQARIRGLLTRRHTGQTRVRIQIYEGEHKMAKDCAKLGELVLDISPARRGQKNVAEVDVTVSIDADRSLVVTAVERRSGATQQLQICRHGWSHHGRRLGPHVVEAQQCTLRLSACEQQRMRAVEEQFVAEDTAAREYHVARNALEQIIFELSSGLTELAPEAGGPGSRLRAVEELLATTTEWIHCEHALAGKKADFDAKRHELESAWRAYRAQVQLVDEIPEGTPPA